MFYYQYETIIGCLYIVEEDNYITGLSHTKPNNNYILKETKLIKKTYHQLLEYFAKKRKAFDIPIKISGTEFQKKVWHALQNIPYGQTKSYIDIARAIGNEKASRAIGMATHNNKIIIIIPCHRVIGKNGKLTGYASGLENKHILLDLEKNNN